MKKISMSVSILSVSLLATLSTGIAAHAELLPLDPMLPGDTIGATIPGDTIGATIPADPTPATVSPNITFTDPNLEICVGAQIPGWTVGTPITQADAENVWGWGGFDTLPECGNLTSLEGLQYLPNLQYVDLGGTFTDLTPLANLTNLTGLNISNAQVDLTPLANSTSLTSLNLWGGKTNTVDLAPIANLTNLTRLNVEGTTLNTSVVSNLTNLTELKLNGDWSANPRVGLTDISFVSNLTNLTVLSLDWGTITDITPIANLTNLTELSMRGNAITNVSPASGFTNTIMDFSGNRISDFSVLGNNTAFINQTGQSISFSKITVDSGVNATQTLVIKDRYGNTPALISATRNGTGETSTTTTFDGTTLTYAVSPDGANSYWNTKLGGDWSSLGGIMTVSIGQSVKTRLAAVLPVVPPVAPIIPVAPPVAPIIPPVDNTLIGNGTPTDNTVVDSGTETLTDNGAPSTTPQPEILTQTAVLADQIKNGGTETLPYILYGTLLLSGLAGLFVFRKRKEQ